MQAPALHCSRRPGVVCRDTVQQSRPRRRSDWPVFLFRLDVVVMSSLRLYTVLDGDHNAAGDIGAGVATTTTTRRSEQLFLTQHLQDLTHGPPGDGVAACERGSRARLTSSHVSCQLS